MKESIEKIYQLIRTCNFEIEELVEKQKELSKRQSDMLMADIFDKIEFQEITKELHSVSFQIVHLRGFVLGCEKSLLLIE